MSVQVYGSYRNSTANSSFQYNYTASYNVLSSPKTGSSHFKANFTETYTNPAHSGIAWLDPNGTVVAVFMNGVNSTGSTAYAELVQLANSFSSVYFYGFALHSYISEPGVHQINQTTVMLGPTSLMVTNYGITSPTSFCNGSGVITNNNFELQVGTIPGTTMPLVSVWSQTGTFTPQSGGWTLSSSGTSRVTSVTKA